MKVLFVSTLVSFLFSCNVQESQTIVLTGTIWECEIAENCLNSYEFLSDSTYKFNSCEMEDEYFGSYYFEDQILFLEQGGSFYDQFLSDSSIHKAERILYEVELQGDKLIHLSSSKFYVDKWVKSDFRFDDKYIYKKVISITK